MKIRGPVIAAISQTPKTPTQRQGSVFSVGLVYVHACTVVFIQCFVCWLLVFCYDPPMFLLHSAVELLKRGPSLYQTDPDRPNQQTLVSSSGVWSSICSMCVMYVHTRACVRVCVALLVGSLGQWVQPRVRRPQTLLVK